MKRSHLCSFSSHFYPNLSNVRMRARNHPPAATSKPGRQETNIPTTQGAPTPATPGKPRQHDNPQAANSTRNKLSAAPANLTHANPSSPFRDTPAPMNPKAPIAVQPVVPRAAAQAAAVIPSGPKTTLNGQKMGISIETELLLKWLEQRKSKEESLVPKNVMGYDKHLKARGYSYPQVSMSDTSLPRESGAPRSVFLMPPDKAVGRERQLIAIPATVTGFCGQPLAHKEVISSLGPATEEVVFATAEQTKYYPFRNKDKYCRLPLPDAELGARSRQS